MNILYFSSLKALWDQCENSHKVSVSHHPHLTSSGSTLGVQEPASDARSEAVLVLKVSYNSRMHQMTSKESWEIKYLAEGRRKAGLEPDFGKKQAGYWVPSSQGQCEVLGY